MSTNQHFQYQNRFFHATLHTSHESSSIGRAWGRVGGTLRFLLGNWREVSGSFYCIAEVVWLNLLNNLEQPYWSKKTKAKIAFVAYEAKNRHLPWLSSSSNILLNFRDNSNNVYFLIFFKLSYKLIIVTDHFSSWLEASRKAFFCEDDTCLNKELNIQQGRWRCVARKVTFEVLFKNFSHCYLKCSSSNECRFGAFNNLQVR